MTRRPPTSTLFPYTTLFRSSPERVLREIDHLEKTYDVKFFQFFDDIFTLDAKRRSEEHTSELQSRENLVCRLLLEKKKKKNTNEETQINSHLATTDNQKKTI